MTVERVGVFPQTTLTLKKAIPNRLAQSQRLPVMESVSVRPKPLKHLCYDVFRCSMNSGGFT